MKKIYVRGYDLLFHRGTKGFYTDIRSDVDFDIDGNYIEIGSTKRVYKIFAPIYILAMKFTWDYVTTFDKIDDDKLLILTIRTIRGDYGNGLDRFRALGAYYNEVQYQVERNIQNGNTKEEDIKLYEE